MIQAEVKPAAELSAEEASAWRGWCAAEPAFRNPLLGPDFAMAVGRARGDARAAVLHRGGTLVGAFAFHERPNGFARPIGSTFSDYHALLSAPGERIDGRQALAAIGVSAIRFTGLIDPRGAFPTMRISQDRGYAIELGGSLEAHDEALRSANPKRFKNWRRLQNKLEREFGEISLEADATSRDDFDALLGWKRDQLRRTGLHDVLRPGWAQELLWDLFEQRSGEMRGAMVLLRAGGRLVAGQFGVVQNGACHVWISAMDPECASCGPGLVLMHRMPQAMAALGVEVWDLGPGYAHYKEGFSSRRIDVGEGLVLDEGHAGRAARSVERAWVFAGDGRVQAVGRLRRRLDHIAAAELTLGGRVRGVVDAIAGYGRRAEITEQVRETVSEIGGAS
jgi:CelD/BcsL family acetyltransferase involved in cellulose biosynthesis